MCRLPILEVTIIKATMQIPMIKHMIYLQELVMVNENESTQTIHTEYTKIYLLVYKYSNLKLINIQGR